MSDLVNLVGRLRAFDAGRALRAASHLQVVIQPHALVIAPLAMAGEDTTIHALAVGPIGSPAQIRVVPDPRVRGVIRLGRTVEFCLGQACLPPKLRRVYAAGGLKFALIRA